MCSTPHSILSVSLLPLWLKKTDRQHISRTPPFFAIIFHSVIDPRQFSHPLYDYLSLSILIYPCFSLLSKFSTRGGKCIDEIFLQCTFTMQHLAGGLHVYMVEH
jgi:hypothetical protein